ncbi:MAG: sulfate adenylyltransferase subunit CysD [Candidatus Omnitrophica bacterium]|nr:sulfate adenylyltransferase subunit CysD [Candidatus Omnitrophota bacterium]
MTLLNKLESDSIYIIREAYSRFGNIALLWSIGKDSTTLLWLCRKAFFGQIPFPVLHIDTSYKFKEIYSFREKYAKHWNLNLLVERNDLALANGMNNTQGKFICCDKLKTQTLKSAIQKYNFQAILLGIRRDEHGIRAKERFFSLRNADQHWNYGTQAPELWDLYQTKLSTDHHFRVHPLLGWREIDVWNYIQQEKIPVTDLYFSKNKKRFRSIGCEPCCAAVVSGANSLKKIIKELQITKTSERSGRAQDKEDSYNMQKLRSLGYM